MEEFENRVTRDGGWFHHRYRTRGWLDTGLFAKNFAVADNQQIPQNTIYLGSVEEDAIVRTKISSTKDVDDDLLICFHTNDVNQTEGVIQGVPVRLKTFSNKI